MLKKELTLKGAVVEVYRIRKGVPGTSDDGPHMQYVLITESSGSALNGGYGAKVGTQLEIVEPPKKRGGINTAVVKVLGDDRNIEGHVFWCELRLSCKLVTASPEAPTEPPAPKRKSSKQLKTFSEKQLARLPEHGYWVESFDGKPQSFICVKNGQVKYTRPGSDGWYTLMWTCCPTAKQIASDKNNKDYEFFADHASLLARYGEDVLAVRDPAPND